MVDRRLKQTTILSAIGISYGIDSVPTGAANAMLVSDVSFKPLEATNVDRDYISEFMGASQSLVGTAFKSLGYSVELTGSGSAGVAPAWGVLLRACGFSETVTVATRVDYMPVSSSFEWCDQYVYVAGVLHKLLGCRGTASLDLSAGVIPKLKFQFKGIDGGIAAVAPSGVNYSGWKTPQVVTHANTKPLLRGCTHSATGAPALLGGADLPYSKFTLDLGVEAPFSSLVGKESVEVTARKITGGMDVELTAAQEVSFMGDVRANTLVSLGMTHGTVAGQKTLIYSPGVQLTEPDHTDLNGKLMNSYKLTLPRTATGNDELRIVTSF